MNITGKKNGAFALLQLVLIVCTLALLAAVAIPKAHAEVGTINVGVTNFFKAQTGYFGVQYCTNVIPCDNADNFDLILTGAGRSQKAGRRPRTSCSDGSRNNLATNTTYAFTFPAPGAGAFTVRTNFPASVVGSAGAFSLVQITNAAANCNLTNVTLTVIKKTNRNMR